MARTRRHACTFIIGALLCALSPFLTVPAAVAADERSAVEVPPYFQRTSTYLCTGYAACKKAGYSHFGYRSAGSSMWWRMYAGHNCTNYVAYRLVKGGMSAGRPWDGTGMAWNWGRANRGKTDNTPMVGAVAWWNRNSNGVGSSGHVAYVEKVINRRTIVISEDSWSGDFHWRRLTKGSGSWPSGFVHFDDREVEQQEPPVVTGQPAVGEPLTAGTGRWTPDAKTSVQWLADGKPIPGATGATLTPTPELRRARLAVRVAATARGYVAGAATSVRTARITRGTFRTVTRPAVSGVARVDQTLELQRAAWSPSPERTAIRWYADGKPIEGATGPRLKLGQEEYGRRISVTMTARAEGYRVARLSTQPTTAVAAGHIKVSEPFTVGGKVRMGRQLSITPGQITPADARVAYTWLRDGVPVPGAVGTTYDLGVDDVGHRMTARVELKLEGYRDKTLLLKPQGRVATDSNLITRATGKPGRAVVKLRVEAPGVEAPGGRAVVRIGKNRVLGKVVDGRLRVVLRHVPRGKHEVRVHYLGAKVVRGSRTELIVRVPRR